MVSLRSALPEDAWQARFGESAARLDDLRERIGAPAWQAALGRAGAEDRALVGLLLKGTLQP